MKHKARTTVGAVLAALVTLWAVAAAALEYGTWQYRFQDGPLMFQSDDPHGIVVTGDNAFAAVQYRNSDGFGVAVLGYFVTAEPASELKSTIVKGSGERFSATIAGEALYATTEPGRTGFAYAFALGDKDAELLKAARTWIVEVGGIRREYSLKGSRYAIQAAQDTARKAGQAPAPAAGPTAAEKARLVEACDAQIGHPWDEQGGAGAVPWDEIDGARAVAACRRAYDSGIRSAYLSYLLGRALDKAGDAEAVTYLSEAARGGHALAYNHLGILYRDKEHGLDSRTRAREMFEVAAEKGSVPGKYNLSLMMIDSGNTEEWALGMRMLQGVADSDYMLGQRKFAEYLENGEAHGIPNPEKAREYYARAADNDDEVSAYRLAVMYRDGAGVAPDPRLYLEYLRFAAEKGHDKAREELGLE